MRDLSLGKKPDFIVVLFSNISPSHPRFVALDPVSLPFRELKRERERAELWRGLEEHQERRMQMLTEAARNQRNLQERGDLGAPSSPQTARSDQPELKSGGASSYASGAAESAT